MPVIQMQAPTAVSPFSHATASRGSGAPPGRVSVWRHLVLPLAGLGLLLGWAGLLGGDQLLADRIYAWEGHAWMLRDAWLTNALIHVAGRNVSFTVWLVLGLAWVLMGRSPSRGGPVRRPLGYLLLATLASCLLVSWFKSWSNMDCPWDLLRYGGHKAFIGLTELRPLGMGRGRCFPAGHASAGYAWMALYFFFLAVAPRWRWLGLGIGVGTGLVFGISQQLRGAHFLSHDLCTAGICWLVALALYVVLLHPSGGAQEAQAGHGGAQ